MTRIYYDTEFLEDGIEIALISIGMVAEDGREYYAVAAEAPWSLIRNDEWLMQHVVSSLPMRISHRDKAGRPNELTPDPDHPDFAAVKDRRTIANEVRDFINATRRPFADVELWAWYGAYDHVALAQLFGRMIDLPSGVPMWTNDLRQEQLRLGDPQLPEQESGVHNALADARHVKVMAEALADLEEQR